MLIIIKHLITVFFIAALLSCQSRKARDLNNVLDSTEKKVFRILTDNKEKDRLEALVARDPDAALSAADKQAHDLRAVY